MRIVALVLGVVAGAAVPALAATGVERVEGVVAPTVGAQVDARGAFLGAGGTQPATVTREQRGATLVVTVTPSL